MGVRSSGSPDCPVAHSAELSARRHLWARCARTCQRQVDLHRNRSQGRQSEQCGFGWFTMSAGNKAILIQTGPQTWKAKRIKRDCLNGPWTGELAHKVERLGYSALWIPEGAGRDPFAHAGYLLSQTEKLIVASGIASVWSRSCSSGGKRSIREDRISCTVD